MLPGACPGEGGFKMQAVAALIIPLIMVIIIITGLVKKVDVFNKFTDGAKEGFSTIYSIAPSLIGLIVAIGMFKASGALELLTQIFEPLTSLIGIPKETTPLFFLRPISGSGSLALLSQIVSDCGADSFAARAAAVMAGSTETTFYCIAVYYGSVKIKKTGCTVPCALLGDFAGMVMACLTVRLIG